MRHAGYLGFTVHHGIKTLPFTIIERPNAARLAEINITSQFPQNHDV